MAKWCRIKRGPCALASCSCGAVILVVAAIVELVVYPAVLKQLVYDNMDLRPGTQGWDNWASVEQLGTILTLF